MITRSASALCVVLLCGTVGLGSTGGSPCAGNAEGDPRGSGSGPHLQRETFPLGVTELAYDPARQRATVRLTNTGDRAIQAWTVGWKEPGVATGPRWTRDLFRKFGVANQEQRRLEPGASDEFEVPRYPTGAEPRIPDFTVETVVFTDGSFAGAASHAHRVLRARAAARQEISSWVARLEEARRQAGASTDAGAVLDDLAIQARRQTHAASLPMQHLIATNLSLAAKAAGAQPQDAEEILDLLETELRTALLQRTTVGSRLFDTLMLPLVEIPAAESSPSLVHWSESGESTCSITTSLSRLTSRNCASLTYNITETWSYQCSEGTSGSGVLAGLGQCANGPPLLECPPLFSGPGTVTTGSDLHWSRGVEHRRIVSNGSQQSCVENGEDTLLLICPCPYEPSEPPPQEEEEGTNEPPPPNSPIVIDLAGEGFSFSGPAPPVTFDLDADGRRERISWVSAGEDEAFLVLDRNGNGVIDDGSEMFGNHTSQPKAEDRHGYRALAVLDEPENGGDGDGEITAADAVFASLRLWLDHDRDGVSGPNELRPLAEEGISALALDYWESKARDEHGNQLRYWSSYRAADGRQGFTVDVFFVPAE